jgi:hypothetical protein
MRVYKNRVGGPQDISGIRVIRREVDFATTTTTMTVERRLGGV